MYLPRFLSLLLMLFCHSASPSELVRFDGSSMDAGENSHLALITSLAAQPDLLNEFNSVMAVIMMAPVLVDPPVDEAQMQRLYLNALDGKTAQDIVDGKDLIIEAITGNRLGHEYHLALDGSSQAAFDASVEKIAMHFFVWHGGERDEFQRALAQIATVAKGSSREERMYALLDGKTVTYVIKQKETVIAALLE
uniref:hypothetical protein n=1 Tax=Thaumasiovibrio occultus TaxID=1891184 RepID=UPI00131E7EBE|nr:hypothetical protein [Thaumasiovibrio occultus]